MVKFSINAPELQVETTLPIKVPKCMYACGNNLPPINYYGVLAKDMKSKTKDAIVRRPMRAEMYGKWLLVQSKVPVSQASTLC
jgi:hypothetical protein